MSTSDRTIRWIENLAEQEVSVISGQRHAIDVSATKERMLAVETATFVRDLTYHLEYLVKLFNNRLRDSKLHIALEKESETGPKVMLSRNNLRLVVTTNQPGKINLQCVKQIQGVPPLKESVMFSGAIEANFGTFDDVDWFFLRSRVNPELLARHYLTEFIQVSRMSSELNS